MKALGIIFANLQNENIDELTRKRTTASIPFGGRYRLIDFALSSLVNAEISKVAVLAQKNYQSLMDHLGSGKDWDLSRRSGGITIFPPFGNYKSDFIYTTHLEALKSIVGYLNRSTEEYVVLMDCDSIHTVDLGEALEYHISKNADITLIYNHGVVEKSMANFMNVETNEDGRVTKMSLNSVPGTKQNISMKLLIFGRRYLLSLIDEAIALGQTSFERDILFNNVNSLNIYAYEYKGVWMKVTTMEDYYRYSMELLKDEVRNGVFGNPDHRIFTKVRDSVPTKYGKNAKVENSFIADGTEIEGTVINSILFRGAKVGKNTVVENSIIMQDTIIGDNVKLNCVVTDKNVTIKDRNNLSGCEKLPYYVSKNVMI